MKSVFILLTIYCFQIAPKAFCQSNIIKSYAGFSFQYPAGWSKSGDDGVYEFTKPGLKVSLNVQPHLYSNRNDMASEIRNTNDANSGLYLKATYSAYGETGLYVKHEGTANGTHIIIQSINLFSPYGVGITISFNSTSVSASNLSIIKQVAESVQFYNPRPSPYAMQWKRRISGRQLLYLYTETGIGSGSYEKRAYDLCSNGQFIMSFDNGYSSSNPDNNFSAGGTDAGKGVWEVYSINGQALLYLKYNNGAVKIKSLVKRENSSELIIDGVKYYISNLEYCR